MIKEDGKAREAASSACIQKGARPRPQKKKPLAGTTSSPKKTQSTAKASGMLAAMHTRTTMQNQKGWSDWARFSALTREGKEGKEVVEGQQKGRAAKTYFVRAPEQLPSKRQRLQAAMP